MNSRSPGIDRPEICFVNWGAIPENCPAPQRDWQTGIFLRNDGRLVAHDISIDPIEIDGTVTAHARKIAQIPKDGIEFAPVWMEGYERKWDVSAAMAEAALRKPGGTVYRGDYIVKVVASYRDSRQFWYRTSAELRYLPAQHRLEFGPCTVEAIGLKRPGEPISCSADDKARPTHETERFASETPAETAVDPLAEAYARRIEEEDARTDAEYAEKFAAAGSDIQKNGKLLGDYLSERFDNRGYYSRFFAFEYKKVETVLGQLDIYIDHLVKKAQAHLRSWPRPEQQKLLAEIRTRLFGRKAHWKAEMLQRIRNGEDRTTAAKPSEGSITADTRSESATHPAAESRRSDSEQSMTWKDLERTFLQHVDQQPELAAVLTWMYQDRIFHIAIAEHFRVGPPLTPWEIVRRMYQRPDSSARPPSPTPKWTLEGGVAASADLFRVVAGRAAARLPNPDGVEAWPLWLDTLRAAGYASIAAPVVVGGESVGRYPNGFEDRRIDHVFKVSADYCSVRAVEEGVEEGAQVESKMVETGEPNPPNPPIVPTDETPAPTDPKKPLLDTAKIIKWIEDEGWTNGTLADRLKVSQRTISSMRNNGEYHGADAVVKLANLIGCEVDTLYLT